MSSGDHTLPTRRIALPLESVRRPGRIKLRVLDDARGVRALTLDEPLGSVGRSRLADLVVDEHSISSVHFELRATERGATVRDLDSTNGVWFGQRRVTQVELHAGDRFCAGTCRFELVDVESVELELIAADKYGRLHGQSLTMRELYTDIERIGPTPLGVLILGETGTGKELTARTLHEASGRTGPLVVLDCGALSPTLAEATIFGFRRGAFTGAEQDQAGVFEAAEGGTLFIDEIGELPLPLQVKLLRAIEYREVTRLGEPGKARSVDVRIVAATHRDLREAVVAGQFREDLYFRLAEAILRTPPLRDRGEDILMLADTFLRDLRYQGLEVELGEDARAALIAHAWPGNVRELRNTIRQAAYLCRRGQIRVDELRLWERQLNRPDRIEDMIAAGAGYTEVQAAVDRLYFARLLETHDNNLTSAAKAIGKSRDTFRKRLRELDLY